MTSTHLYIIGGALTLAGLATGALAQQPQSPLNTLNDIGAALREGLPYAVDVPPPLTAPDDRRGEQRAMA